MSVFMRHLTEGGEASTQQDVRADEMTDSEKEMMVLAEAACDEELLGRK